MLPGEDSTLGTSGYWFNFYPGGYYKVMLSPKTSPLTVTFGGYDAFRSGDASSRVPFKIRDYLTKAAPAQLSASATSRGARQPNQTDLVNRLAGSR
jgi:hypothetical protein